MSRTHIRLSVVAGTLAPLLIGAALVAGTIWLSIGTPAAAVQTDGRRIPTFVVDPSWPKVPAKWKLGDVSSFAIDAQDNVWALHRPRTLLKPEEIEMAAPPVVVFDAAGNFIRAWGGAGSGYEWPEREHGIYIDNKGFVWISGNNCPTNGLPRVRPVNDDQILKFSPDGTFVLQIGRSTQSKGNADTRNVNRASDMAVHAPTNELFVADGYGNRRIVVFDATSGAFKRMWGAFGNRPVDDYHCEVVRMSGFLPGPGPEQFNTLHAIRVAKDGMVYVADRENRRVQSFTAAGKFVKQLIKTDSLFARDLTFSPDPAQQFLYVGNGDDILVLNRATLDIVGAINTPGILNGHHMATDSKGNIYIAGATRGYQKLAIKGM